MRIEEATAFLYSLNPKGIRFGLENTRLVLEKLGRPQDSFKAIHLAGSNGKGSTAAFMASVLKCSGRRVGLYTSPHLNDFRERFRVDGLPLSDDLIGQMTERLLADGLDLDPGQVLDWIERENMVERMSSSTWYSERLEGSDFCRLTFFECTTILAFLLFEQAQVEWAVIETGMGGRLDATNVLEPEVCAITPVSLEHTEWLGDTVEVIAGEKAGIIKPGVPLVCGRQQPDAHEVIANVAAEHGSQVTWLGQDLAASGDWRSAIFHVAGKDHGPFKLGLAGPHQMDNAAVSLGCLAASASDVWPLSEAVLAEGLGSVSWPGRFERFGEGESWVLDGAHNPDGARVLAQTLEQAWPGEKMRMVFGVLGDKDASEILSLLEPFAAEVHLVRPVDSRGRDPSEVVEFLTGQARIHHSLGEAMDFLAELEGPRVLVTGSLTVVGEARRWLLDAGYESKSAE